MTMKKCIVFIVALLYIIVSSGIVVNVHYCMGRLTSVEYGRDIHTKCGKCGMASKSKGCCHTESKLIKIEDEHQLVKVNLPLTSFSAEMPTAFFSLGNALTPNASVGFNPFYYVPPDSRLNHVYLSNCVFRI